MDVDVLIGTILLWPVPFVPMGWALCDGTILQIVQNQALFALIGNIYGGNGSSNFALPDLRHRVPVGSQLVDQAGQYNGAANPSLFNPSITIGLNNLPPHNHPATFTPGGGGSSVSIPIPAVANPSAASITDVPGNTVSLCKGIDSDSGTPMKIYSSDATTTNLKPFSVNVPAGSGTVAVGNTGSGSPLTVSVPYLTLNYIIALQGIFPSRQ